jgi:hypothetical protein
VRPAILYVSDKLRFQGCPLFVVIDKFPQLLRRAFVIDSAIFG